MNALLVKDELDLCDALSDAPVSRGFQPVRGHAGMDGLHIALHRKFGAVILNLTKPGLDAVEASQRPSFDEVKVPDLSVTEPEKAVAAVTAVEPVSFSRRYVGFLYAQFLPL